eukprot:scpid34927/ scgid27830/ 
MTTVAAPLPGSIGAVPAMPSLRVLAPMDTEDLFSRTSGSVVARQRSSSFSALHGSAPPSYNCPTPFSALAHNRNGSAIGGLLDSSSSCLAPESSSSNSNYHHHQTQQQQHQHQHHHHHYHQHHTAQASIQGLPDSETQAPVDRGHHHQCSHGYYNQGNGKPVRVHEEVKTRVEICVKCR